LWVFAFLSFTYIKYHTFLLETFISGSTRRGKRLIVFSITITSRASLHK
jgi:hypothetical protein